MFKELFSKRLFIVGLAFFVLCVGGSLFYMQHVKRQDTAKLAETQERIKQWDAARKTPAPVADTSQGGHWQGDEWHAGPHDAPTAAHARGPVIPTEVEKVGPVFVPLPSGIVPDWASMSPDELAAAIKAIEKRHVAAPDGYYYKRKPDGRLLHDENGYPTLHKIGEPDFKVVKAIGFAPTREEYARYQRVQQEFAEAQTIGNTSEVERLQRELQHMYNTFRGEIPEVSYSFHTTDPHADIEALHKDAALRARHLSFEAYRKAGFEYLIPTEFQ